MNLEMPSPAETDSLRTILLIVLGVMILTIPVVCVIVVAKVTAQRKQRPAPGTTQVSASQDAGRTDPMMVAGGLAFAALAASPQEDAPHLPHEVDHSGPPDNTTPMTGGDSSWVDHSSNFSDGGSSISDGGSAGAGGDAGGGGGGGSSE